MGTCSRPFDVLLFLAHRDELGVALLLESDKDADSILRFSLICNEVGGGVCLVDWQPVSSPARVLVFRPPSSTQSSADEFIDVRAVVAIFLDVEAAEVVLKDVVGHGVAIIVEPCWASLLPGTPAKKSLQDFCTIFYVCLSNY